MMVPDKLRLIPVILFFLVFGRRAYTLSFNAPMPIDGPMLYSHRFIQTDLNGDHLQDIVVTQQSDELQFFWFERKSAIKPEYTRHGVKTLHRYWDDFSIADLDQDGDQDIVVSRRYNEPQLLWLANDGNPHPSFAPHVIDHYHYSMKNLMVDIDGDSDQDIISATAYRDQQSPTAVRLYLNNGASPPQFSAHIVYQDHNDGTRISHVKVADLDGDGYLDILFTLNYTRYIADRADTGGIYELRNLRMDSPSFQAARIHETLQPLDMELADLDQDGDDDIVAAFYNHDVLWLENQPFSEPGFVQHRLEKDIGQASDIVVVDADLDEDLDVFVLYVVEDTVLFYENNGGSQPSFSSQLLDQPYRPVHMRPADLDSDGDPDLICLSREMDSLSWYENRMIVAEDIIDVSPLAGFESSGKEGGPFDPENHRYMITNHSPTQSLDWRIETNADWLSVKPSQGILSPDSAILIEVAFNETAKALQSGNYAAQLEFCQAESDMPVTLTNIDLHIVSRYFDVFLEPRSIAGTGYAGEFQITDLNRNGVKEILSTDQHTSSP